MGLSVATIVRYLRELEASGDIEPIPSYLSLSEPPRGSEVLYPDAEGLSTRGVVLVLRSAGLVPLAIADLLGVDVEMVAGYLRELVKGGEFGASAGLPVFD